MTAQTLLSSLFRYKASVDEELLEALSSVQDDIPPSRLASALRVLHHAHVVDRIFAAHLRQQAHGHATTWSDQAPGLSDLASGMREIDAWYVDYVSAVGPHELEEAIDFDFTDGGRGRMSREEMLAHVVTHAGYHRGEAGRLLPEIGKTGTRDVFAGYLHRADPHRRM